MDIIAENIRIRAQYAPWYAAVELLVSTTVSDGRRSMAKKIIFEEVKEGSEIESTLRIPKKAAQLLLDDLWHCGFRPSENIDTGGELKATKYHLEDMRKLVFEDK